MAFASSNSEGALAPRLCLLKLLCETGARRYKNNFLAHDTKGEHMPSLNYIQKISDDLLHNLFLTENMYIF